MRKRASLIIFSLLIFAASSVFANGLSLNSIGTKYSFDDYVEGYAAAKLEHYENALAFRKKYKFTAAVFMFIWTGSKSRCTSGVAMNNFKTGNLVINDLKKCYDIADNLTYLINEFKNELPLHKRWLRRRFLHGRCLSIRRT